MLVGLPFDLSLKRSRQPAPQAFRPSVRLLKNSGCLMVSKNQRFCPVEFNGLKHAS
jgi:hypothetical protein